MGLIHIPEVIRKSYEGEYLEVGQYIWVSWWLIGGWHTFVLSEISCGPSIDIFGLPGHLAAAQNFDRTGRLGSLPPDGQSGKRSHNQKPRTPPNAWNESVRLVRLRGPKRDDCSGKELVPAGFETKEISPARCLGVHQNRPMVFVLGEPGMGNFACPQEGYKVEPIVYIMTMLKAAHELDTSSPEEMGVVRHFLT
ncbi:hypothetical protein HOY80DRAFT_1034589 [Tuber brumale]|nr:hypothetical protein HOY80DRAFT_1034589 [Tuber brumale]